MTILIHIGQYVVILKDSRNGSSSRQLVLVEKKVQDKLQQTDLMVVCKVLPHCCRTLLHFISQSIYNYLNSMENYNPSSLILCHN